MKLLQLGLVVALSVGLFSCVGSESTTEGPTQNSTVQGTTPETNVADLLKAPDGGKLITMSVDGMSCQFNCAPKVQETLAKIEGVEGVKVDFETKQAVVAVKDAKFDGAKLESALASTNQFTGKVKS